MKNHARKDFDYLRRQLLYRKIIKWNENEITLDNGTVLKIEETEQDCCASAGGSFKNVVLDAAITNVSDIKYSPWEDSDTYGCSAVVTIETLFVKQRPTQTPGTAVIIILLLLSLYIRPKKVPALFNLSVLLMNKDRKTHNASFYSDSKLDVHRLKPTAASSYATKKVLDKISFLCYNRDTLIEDERPINEI